MSIKSVSTSLLTLLVGVIFAVPVQAFESFPQSLAWELISQSGMRTLNTAGEPYSTIYAMPGETVAMSMTVRNMSRNPKAEVWYGKSALLPEGPQYPNAHAIGVGTWSPMDHVPAFIEPSSFVINNNRLVYYDGPAIHKGATITLNWEVKLKQDLEVGSVHELSLALVREFDEWGWRTNPSGTNHKYRSARYRFVIGEEQQANMVRFVHANNGIALDYPVGLRELSNDYGVQDARQANNFYLTSSTSPEDDSFELIFEDYYDRGGSSKSLAAFANEVWNDNKNDTNPNVSGKTVGELRQGSLNGNTAYYFDADKSFYYSGADGGFTLPDTTRFWIFQDGRGHNYIAHSRLIFLEEANRIWSTLAISGTI